MPADENRIKGKLILHANCRRALELQRGITRKKTLHAPISWGEWENYSILFSHLEGISLWYLLSLIHQQNIVCKWHSAPKESDELKTQALEDDWLQAPWLPYGQPIPQMAQLPFICCCGEKNMKRKTWRKKGLRKLSVSQASGIALSCRLLEASTRNQWPLLSKQRPHANLAGKQADSGEHAEPLELLKNIYRPKSTLIMYSCRAQLPRKQRKCYWLNRPRASEELRNPMGWFLLISGWGLCSALVRPAEQLQAAPTAQKAAGKLCDYSAFFSWHWSLLIGSHWCDLFPVRFQAIFHFHHQYRKTTESH